MRACYHQLKDQSCASLGRYLQHTMTSLSSDSSTSFLDHVHCSICYRSFSSTPNEPSTFEDAVIGNVNTFWMAEVS